MVLTRAQNQPGPDGKLFDDPTTPADETADNIQDANNTDSPWVDQSQTYTSHASHQVFLREYSMVANRPVSTGKLLGGIVNDDPITPACTGPTPTATCFNDGNATSDSATSTGSISTWASTKKQAKEINLAQLTWLLEQEGLKVRLEDLIEHPSFLGQMAVLALHNTKHQDDIPTEHLATGAILDSPEPMARVEKNKAWSKAKTLARKLTRRNNTLIANRA